MGFIVACVGALFLTEQYYPPLWFLPAIGASLASLRPRAAKAGDDAVVAGDDALTSGQLVTEPLLLGGPR